VLVLFSRNGGRLIVGTVVRRGRGGGRSTGSVCGEPGQQYGARAVHLCVARPGCGRWSPGFRGARVVADGSSDGAVVGVRTE